MNRKIETPTVGEILREEFMEPLGISAYRLAKEANDPLYTKMLKYRTLWKQTSNKILEKYGNKADRIAKKTQQEYIRNYSKNVKAGLVKEPKVTK